MQYLLPFTPLHHISPVQTTFSIPLFVTPFSLSLIVPLKGTSKRISYSQIPMKMVPIKALLCEVFSHQGASSWGLEAIQESLSLVIP